MPNVLLIIIMGSTKLKIEFNMYLNWTTSLSLFLCLDSKIIHFSEFFFLKWKFRAVLTVISRVIHIHNI